MSETPDFPSNVPRDEWLMRRIGVAGDVVTFSGMCRREGWQFEAVIRAPAEHSVHLQRVLFEAFFTNDDDGHNLDDIKGWCDLSGLPVDWHLEQERLIDPFDYAAMPRPLAPPRPTPEEEARDIIARNDVAAIARMIEEQRYGYDEGSDDDIDECGIETTDEGC